MPEWWVFQEAKQTERLVDCCHRSPTSQSYRFQKVRLPTLACWLLGFHFLYTGVATPLPQAIRVRGNVGAGMVMKFVLTYLRAAQVLPQNDSVKLWSIWSITVGTQPTLSAISPIVCCYAVTWASWKLFFKMTASLVAKPLAAWRLLPAHAAVWPRTKGGTPIHAIMIKASWPWPGEIALSPITRWVCYRLAIGKKMCHPTFDKVDPSGTSACLRINLRNWAGRQRSRLSSWIQKRNWPGSIAPPSPFRIME